MEQAPKPGKIPPRNIKIRRMYQRLRRETERPLNMKIALLHASDDDLAAIERLLQRCEAVPHDRPIKKPEPAAAAIEVAA